MAINLTKGQKIDIGLTKMSVGLDGSQTKVQVLPLIWTHQHS